MSVFRQFEDAKRQFERASNSFGEARTALASASERIGDFQGASVKTLGDVLKTFAQNGLLPGIDIEYQSHMLVNEIRIADRVAPRSITIKGIGINSVDSPADVDFNGTQVCEKIVNAANKKNIPIVHDKRCSNGIEVSPRIKESEKAPEILLKALAAYAESKEKPDMAKVATDAAERMKKLVSSYRELK